MGMDFTSLHRAVGAQPQPLTNELLSEAVAAGVAETHDLDWKSQLPPKKALPQSDFPKDVAAMANNGGGLIIFGVKENQKTATERVDVGDFDEGYERALRMAAITSVSPPVFGLKIHRLGTEANQDRAVVVEVAASLDGPHLIFRNELFGAPVRSDSDTVWMKERQIEAMYKARFEERRHAAEVLDALYSGEAGGRDATERAWIIGVAHPRIPVFHKQPDRDLARQIFSKSTGVALALAGRSGVHPLENVDVKNPRPGLRRWIAVNTAKSEQARWKEAWVGVHQDGSVTVAAAVGGHRSSAGKYLEGHLVEGRGIESAVADLMALIRTTAKSTGNDNYEIRVGVEWAGQQPLQILTVDNMGFTYEDVSTPLHRFVPVEMSVDAQASDTDFQRSVYELAKDCVNQGGVSNLQLIKSPD